MSRQINAWLEKLKAREIWIKIKFKFGGGHGNNRKDKDASKIQNDIRNNKGEIYDQRHEKF
jgi:hypothetical protein